MIYLIIYLSISMILSHESPLSPPRGPMGGGAFIVALREHCLQYIVIVRTP
eukprot:COSAG05_NODE_79_length_21178_cov_133.299492_17_plen_51_part_00